MIEFLGYYVLFAACTGLASIINVWLPLRRVALEYLHDPFEVMAIKSFYLHFAMFAVGFVFAPYMFWETIFGPSKSLAKGILEACLKDRKNNS